MAENGEQAIVWEIGDEILNKIGQNNFVISERNLFSKLRCHSKLTLIGIHGHSTDNLSTRRQRRLQMSEECLLVSLSAHSL